MYAKFTAKKKLKEKNNNCINSLFTKSWPCITVCFQNYWKCYCWFLQVGMSQCWHTTKWDIVGRVVRTFFRESNTYYESIISIRQLSWMENMWSTRTLIFLYLIHRFILVPRQVLDIYSVLIKYFLSERMFNT